MARDPAPASARVVQLSDTHLSHTAGVPGGLRALLDWIRADPPDLVVHTGDIVYEDPDDAADRAFAVQVFSGLPCPMVAIPGNHDVGFYGEDDRLAERLAAFCAAWGADRFLLELAGWRLVGINAYLLGDAEHDAWVRRSVGAGNHAGPVAVFVHQPVAGDTADGWEMPSPARAAFDRAIAGGDVRLVASGHRHRSSDRGRDVWAPSTTMTGDHWDDGGASDPAPGALELRFTSDGTVRHRVVRPT